MWLKITECIIFVHCIDFVMFILSSYFDKLIIEISRLIVWFTKKAINVLYGTEHEHMIIQWADSTFKILSFS